MERAIQKLLQKVLFRIIPNLRHLNNESIDWYMVTNILKNSTVSSKTKLNGPYRITNSTVGDYTYIALNSYIMYTDIGKFCSIGPNFISGFGAHPTNAISTNPMFYSTRKQNGYSLVDENKIDEVPPNTIGNDVFIGANVTMLNGIEIGDGAIIGAGSIVSKDIPPYAIAVGAPIKVIKYRFNDKVIDDLLKIKWWDKDYSELQSIEENFFDVEKYITYTKSNN